MRRNNRTRAGAGVGGGGGGIVAVPINPSATTGGRLMTRAHDKRPCEDYRDLEEPSSSSNSNNIKSNNFTASSRNIPARTSSRPVGSIYTITNIENVQNKMSTLLSGYGKMKGLSESIHPAELIEQVVQDKLKQDKLQQMQRQRQLAVGTGGAQSSGSNSATYRQVPETHMIIDSDGTSGEEEEEEEDDDEPDVDDITRTVDSTACDTTSSVHEDGDNDDDDGEPEEDEYDGAQDHDDLVQGDDEYDELDADQFVVDEEQEDVSEEQDQEEEDYDVEEVEDEHEPVDITDEHQQEDDVEEEEEEDEEALEDDDVQEVIDVEQHDQMRQQSFGKQQKQNNGSTYGGGGDRSSKGHHDKDSVIYNGTHTAPQLTQGELNEEEMVKISAINTKVQLNDQDKVSLDDFELLKVLGTGGYSYVSPKLLTKNVTDRNKFIPIHNMRPQENYIRQNASKVRSRFALGY
uniref:Uncharacterized protein n=1 Tax=Anopheles minimus TaxID=112268 RepID=A0A182WHT3_9DIPT